MAIYRDGKVLEHTIYGASRLGVYKRQVTGASPYFYELTDHLGNVRAVVSKETNETVAIKGATDYYPFGMVMPARNLQGDYRYAYQGQEKDPETGKEAFELRLWDSRIGRWLTTDPYGQFHSPYLGMGNNPTNVIDPDGGFACVDSDGNAIPCPDGHQSYGSVANQYDAFFDADMNFIGEGLRNDPVFLTGAGGNDLGNALSTASSFGSAGLDLFNKSIPDLSKSDFLLKRIDPKFAIDFRNSIPSSAMGNVYEKGAKQALSTISTIKNVTKYTGYGLTGLSYAGAVSSAINEDYNNAAAETVKATGETISGYGGFLGIAVYNGVWWVGDSYLVKSETYNRMVFGVHSKTYQRRVIEFGF